MAYVDGFVAAVPKSNKAKYVEHARKVGEVLKENGAIQYLKCWADEVPKGEVTSFPLAVKCAEDEDVVFAWIYWNSKEEREAGMKKTMEDPQIQIEMKNMPFDGKRLIYGGFEPVAEF